MQIAILILEFLAEYVLTFLGGNEITVENSPVEYRGAGELQLTQNTPVKTFSNFGLQWQLEFDVSINDKPTPEEQMNIMDIRKLFYHLLFEL